MIYVFLIVNAKSGEGCGKELLRLGFNYLSLRKESTFSSSTALRGSGASHNGEKVKLVIDSIQPPAGSSPKLEHNYRLFDLIERITRTKQTNPNTLRIMVAGGDGTLMWCIQCLRQHNINLEAISIGIVPLGTGNDFARAVGCLGFGATCRRLAPLKGGLLYNKQTDETYVEMMTRLLHSWLDLRPELIDLWNVQIKVNTCSGAFHKIDSQTRKKKKIRKPQISQFASGDTRQHGINLPADEPTGLKSNKASPLMHSNSAKKTVDVTELSLSMSNYFSIGIESRIGIGFDRNRTKSLALNKLAYVFEAFKKLVFHKSYCISSLISSIHTKAKEDDADWEPLCVTRRSPKNSHIPLLAPCVSLIFLNIPSFAGGLDVWRSARGKLGLLKPTNLVDGGDSWASLLKSSCSGDQSIGDTKLDLIAFKSLVELSLSNFQRYVPNPPSSGWRLAQAGSVIKIEFDSTQNITGKDRRKIYFQVDGEFFIATDVESIVISFDHKIHVLTNPTGKIMT